MSAEEVSRIIEKFKLGKRLGLDNITAEMGKNTSDLIKTPLTPIINCYFAECIFPVMSSLFHF